MREKEGIKKDLRGTYVHGELRMFSEFGQE